MTTEEPMPILDDRLDTPSVPSLCREADALRNTGVMMLRAYYKFAAMADAAASRSPRLMLESLRAAKSLYLETFRFAPDPDLLAELDATEAKLIRLVEREGWRVS
jgi:hypothetical protein